MTEKQFGWSPTVYNQILQEICEDEKIHLSWHSSGWLGLLEHGGLRHFILGHNFDLNSAASALVADDKFATYEIIHQAGLPMPEHRLLYPVDHQAPYVAGRSGHEYLRRCFTDFQGNIVIKPNLGQCGNFVYHLEALSDAEQILPRVFSQSLSASICPFQAIQHEYRVILLDGDARLVYQKTRGQDWRFNLSHGAMASPVHDESLREQIVQLAQKVAKTLNLRFTSVDVIKNTNGELLLMEANSGVMTEGYLAQHPEDYALIKAIYRDAIRKMFES